jgi:hypothetical protein
MSRLIDENFEISKLFEINLRETLKVADYVTPRKNKKSIFLKTFSKLVLEWRSNVKSD